MPCDSSCDDLSSQDQMEPQQAMMLRLLCSWVQVHAGYYAVSPHQGWILLLDASRGLQVGCTWETVVDLSHAELDFALKGWKVL